MQWRSRTCGTHTVPFLNVLNPQKDGFEVEFEAITDENGKLKAQNVTAADGKPCPGPEPRERRGRRKKVGAAGESGDETGGETGGEKSDDGGADDKAEKKGKNRRRRNNKNGKKAETPKAPSVGKPQPKSWYSELEKSVQESMESRGIKVDAGRAFVAVGDARIKLGTGGYAALFHKNGVVAEGTYTCDKDGKVAATWQHVLKFDSEWKLSTADAESASLLASLALTDGM